MAKPMRVSVTLPDEMLKAIDNKALADGLTRQQILCALLDLGLNRSTYPDKDDILGVLNSIRLLRSVEGTEVTWARAELRKAVWKHLTALVSGGR